MEIIVITLLYFVSYIFIPLNAGIFWDDWCLYHQNELVVFSFHKESGFFLYWPAYLHSLMLSVSYGILIERLVIFFSFLCSTVLLFDFLKKIKEIDRMSRFFIMIFFSIFPLIFSRIGVAALCYALSNLFFYLGLFLVGRYFDKRKIHIRIMALMAIFLSFSTNSILFFYLIVLLFIVYKERRTLISIRSLVNKCLNYIDFLLLPVAFWILKNMFFKPYGLYDKYNQIYIYSPLKYLFQALIAFYNTFIYLIVSQFIPFFQQHTVLIFIASMILFFIFKKIINIRENNKYVKYDLRFLILGFFAFFTGVFPYLAVGKMPQLYGWESRHELLLPLGLSLILFYSVKIIAYYLKLSFTVKLFVYSFIISLFIFFNQYIYLEYQKDWFKQLSLIENFQESQILKENTTFIFEDRTLGLNALKRIYDFYEYNGLMKYAFGDQKRFGSDSTEFTNINDYRIYIADPKYNMYDYEIKEPQYKVIIDYNKPDILNNGTTLKLLWNEFFNNKEFITQIKRIVRLDYIQLKGEK